MGLVQRVNPVGIDKIIDELQSDLFIELTNNFGWTNYESFDRAYRNKKKEDTLAEVYLQNGEYKEVLFNDNQTVTSFFLADERRAFTASGSKFEQDVCVIFQANLKKLFPLLTNRGDEEMIDNIYKAIKNKHWDERLTEVITGVDRVYESLKISYNKKYFDDMSYFSIARFNFKLLYTNTKCSTQAIK